MKEALAKSKFMRRPDGKTMIKSILFVAVVLLALVTLGLNFFNLKIKGEAEHSPIEIAALSAANSISKIVINTEEFGYVSLAYYKPTRAANAAEDGYALPVRSINELLATNRLNLIVADQLDLPIMTEIAKRDHDKLLLIKDKLIATIKASLNPEGSVKDIDGKDLNSYKVAETAYQRALAVKNENADYEEGSLKLEIGSLKSGIETALAIPKPDKYANTSEEQKVETHYKSYTNIPFKDTDFVFGGIGKTESIVKPESFTDKSVDTPYQFPTIIKASIKEDKDSKVACAQPGCNQVYFPVSGALTISFPDGPVPEISKPKDIYENKQLKSPEIIPMKLLTSKGGDYPVDSNAYFDALKWPLNQTSNWQPTAQVWQLALYDWLRRAGPEANLDSIVNMQNVELDSPRPKNLLWKAPLIRGGQYVTLQPISSGIAHIFEFDKDGIIDYRSKIIYPFPLYAASSNQLYGKGIAALSFSEIGEKVIHLPTSPDPKKIVLKAAWDVYIRDDIRNLGSKNGGKHGGEPLAMPLLSKLYQLDYSSRLHGTPYAKVELMSLTEEEESTARVYDKGKDIGYQPLIAPQSEFAESMVPKPPFVRPMPFGRGARPLYETNATAIDIRFRRQIDVSELNGELSTGYFGIVQEEDSK